MERPVTIRTVRSATRGDKPINGRNQPSVWHVVSGAKTLKTNDPRSIVKIGLVVEHLLDPLRWKRPRRVLVSSMSDLFHESLPDEAIDRIFAVMALAPRHQFQVLTKRPERMRRYFSAGSFRDALVADQAQPLSKSVRPFALPSEEIFDGRRVARGERWGFVKWPLPNVWLGVSVEDQATADERIPLLLQTPAAVRWVSAEPLLGPVDLHDYLAESVCGNCGYMGKESDWESDPDGGTAHCPKCDSNSSELDPEYGDPIDWVVAGGESGPGARPMHPAWARSLRDQCQAAGVPFFFKQLDGKRKAMEDFPADLRIREFPNA